MREKKQVGAAAQLRLFLVCVTASHIGCGWPYDNLIDIHAVGLFQRKANGPGNRDRFQRFLPLFLKACRNVRRSDVITELCLRYTW